MSPYQKIKRFFTEHSWYTVGSNVNNILNYLNSFLIGRLLGPAGMGDIGSFSAYLSLLGIPISIVGTFVTQNASLPRYFHLTFNFIRKYFTWYMLIFLGVCIFSWIFRDVIQTLTHLSYVSSILLLPDVWLSILLVPLMALTLGAERYRANVLAGSLAITIKLLAIPVIFFLHWFSSDISIVAISVGQFIATGILLIYLHTQLPHGQAPDWGRIFEFAYEKRLIYTVLGSASMILVVNIDVVLARRLFDPTSAGIYATWSLLSKVVFFTLGPLLTVSFVKQSKLVNKGSRLFDSSVLPLVVFCLASTVPLFIGYQYIAPIMLKIIFGTRFDALYEHLGLSGIFGALTLLLNHLTNMHIARRSWSTAWTFLCVGGFIFVAYTTSLTLWGFYLAINGVTAVACALLCLDLYRKK